MKNRLFIPTMKCGGCVSSVEKALLETGATNIRFDLEVKTADFDSDQDLQALIAAVKDAGYAATSRG